ncbi:uncharacterized protein METZ01_LOCUS201016 [marine metagenome]|uniref:Uncharacterized protein n=1 Tax=marine metagenome TaxID=408172 RepID=A0A382ECU1_9ZZZZ
MTPGEAISIAYNPANTIESIFSKLNPIIAIEGNIGDNSIRIITPNPIILGWARKKPKNFFNVDVFTFSSSPSLSSSLDMYCSMS